MCSARHYFSAVLTACSFSSFFFFLSPTFFQHNLIFSLTLYTTCTNSFANTRTLNSFGLLSSLLFFHFHPFPPALILSLYLPARVFFPDLRDHFLSFCVAVKSPSRRLTTPLVHDLAIRALLLSFPPCPSLTILYLIDTAELLPRSGTTSIVHFYNCCRDNAFKLLWPSLTGLYRFIGLWERAEFHNSLFFVLPCST